ncbi:hypothetical protein HK103_005367 [Boothiomyces macroporosus]|uniref:Uncharacterized protein n=1 Tax=Boothiomyces macroporosus TaxID=261099 RepID=A0AAD5ULL6_9FUNG|nr:hypothetical protein HK103_005367 [Boothiomyces macroporosus]
MILTRNLQEQMPKSNPPVNIAREVETPQLKLCPITSNSLSYSHASFLNQLFQLESIRNSTFCILQSLRIPDFDSWTSETIHKLIQLWKEDCQIPGCGVWVIFQEKEKEDLPMDVNTTYPPRNISSSKKTPIGLATLSPSENDPDECILNIFIHPNNNGKGFGFEAAKALLKANLFPRRIFPDIFPVGKERVYKTKVSSFVNDQDANCDRWTRLLEKLGMSLTGQFIIAGRLSQVFTISREEFMDLWIPMDE